MAEGAPGPLKGSNDSLTNSNNLTKVYSAPEPSSNTWSENNNSSLSNSSSSISSLTSSSGSNSPFAVPAATTRRGSVSLVKSASTTVPDLYGTMRGGAPSASSHYSNTGSIGHKGFVSFFYFYF